MPSKVVSPSCEGHPHFGAAKKGTNVNMTSHSSPRRPENDRFDSLQCLLEQAGYKETRVFTPIHVKAPASPPETMQCASTSIANEASRTTFDAVQGKDASDDDENVEEVKALASRSSWFQTSWSRGKGATKVQAPSRASSDRASSSSSDASLPSIGQGLRRKQSEPAMSKSSYASSWSSSFWGTAKEAEEHPTAKVKANDAGTQNETAVTKRPSLRHAPSTHSLWQASMQHHRNQGQEGEVGKSVHRTRSFPARIASQSNGKAVAVTRTSTAVSLRMTRKLSYDGASVVANVGVRAASVRDVCSSTEVLLNRVGLRDAFGNGDPTRVAGTKQPDRPFAASDANDPDRRDSVSDLEDLVAEAVASNLFASAAAPLLSRDDAVAMRNSACLEMNSMPSGITSPPSATRLRKMRSVDALELALARMQAGSSVAQIADTMQSTIPESDSAESLSAEDFAHAKTTLEQDSPMRITRCPTPTLVITSPTGERPPQPLVLDGVEFDPVSFSPINSATAQSSVVRPTPVRTGWKLTRRTQNETKEGQKAERGRSMENGATRRVIARRSLNDLSSVSVEEERLHPPRLRKRSTTKSKQNLRQAAATSGADRAQGVVLSSTGKLSGSEQIRALHKSVQQRGQDMKTALSSQHPVPHSPTEQSEDDPFSDLAAITEKKCGGQKSHTVFDDPTAKIDRAGMSSAPCDRRHPPRAPFSDQQAAQNVEHRKGKVLNGKRSGVGLACLVDLDRSAEKGQRRTVRPSSGSSARSSSSVEFDEAQNDENVNPLLDSPTNNALRRVNRRISRPRMERY